MKTAWSKILRQFLSIALFLALASGSESARAKAPSGQASRQNMTTSWQPICQTAKVTEISIEGAGPNTRAWLQNELKLKTGEKTSLQDLQKLADKLFASNQFLSVNFSLSTTDRGIRLTLKVQEVPERIQFIGIEDPGKQEDLVRFFPRPMTPENITRGMAALQNELENNPEHLLTGLDFKTEAGQLQILVSMVQVPTQLSLKGSDPADLEKIKRFFEPPYNNLSIEKGLERLMDFYTVQGLVLPFMDFEVRGEQLLLDFVTAPMPTKMEINGVSVYNNADVHKCFPSPLTMENIQKGIQALQQKYQDDGWLLRPQKQSGDGLPETVSADLNKDILTINVQEAIMSDIVISGKGKTLAEVITQELADQKDRPVNLDTIDKRLALIRAKGLFASVTHTVEPDPENPDKVKLHIHISEDKSSDICDPLQGPLEFNFINFTVS